MTDNRQTQRVIHLSGDQVAPINCSGKNKAIVHSQYMTGFGADKSVRIGRDKCRSNVKGCSCFACVDALQPTRLHK